MVEPRKDPIEQETGEQTSDSGGSDSPDSPDTPDQTTPEETAMVAHVQGPDPVSVLLRVALALLSGAPLVAVGMVLLIDSQVDARASLVILGIGLAAILAGLYLGFSGSWLPLDLLPEERPLSVRHPSLKPAFARMITSLIFFVGAIYLLYTEQSYPIYYFALFVVAVYLYYRGVIIYWLNRHTTYYVTNRRVVRLRRFAGLSTTEIPVRAVNSITVTRNFFELVSGRGGVMVSSGIGNLHKVRMEDISDPIPVARTIRELLPEQ